MQILLLTEHVSGTTIPIIRSSRVLYSGCCLWYFTKLLFTFYSKKYHRQQPLYNTHELLMMGVVVPETCRASNKVCNKNLCCIYLAFYFHILTTMHGQNHIKFGEPSQHSLVDTGKPRKPCVEVAGRRTFRILTSNQQSGI